MRFFRSVFIFFASTLLSLSLQAAEAKVIKVLPHYLNAKGQHTLSPSLYERDAYQDYLRHHPKERSALRFDIQWKAKDVDWSNVKLRVYLRGVKSNVTTTRTLEAPVKKKGWFSNWTSVKIAGQDYKKFGELVAWRATLVEDDTEIAEQKSFLW